MVAAGNLEKRRSGRRLSGTIGRRLLGALSLLVLAACGSSTFSPTPDETVVFADPPVPATASPSGSAPSDKVISVVLGLVRDDAGLAQRVRDIADPSSPHYKQHQAVADTAAEFGASADAVEAIVAQLERRGIAAKLDVTGGFIATSMTLAQAASLFHTRFEDYSVPGRGTFFAPAKQPSAPPSWQGTVREVMGLSTLPSLADAADAAASRAALGPIMPARPAFTVISQPGDKGASGNPAGCEDALGEKGFKPNQLLAAYGVQPLRDQGYLGQGIRMALVEDGIFAQSDIDTFTSCYAVPSPVTPTPVMVGTQPLPTGVDTETTLDIEVTLAVAPQLAALYVFETGDQSLADKVLLYASPLDPANTGGEQIQILSSSLGDCEAQLTQGYVDLVEYVLAVAVAADVSVFASAGDSGSSTCYHHDQSVTALSASYPATSAYATVVGGTNLLLDASTNAIVGSSVWNDQPWNGEDSAGGGGPSVFVAAPPWQSTTGTGEAWRTTPDVAFFGDPLPGYAIYNATNGGWYDDGGTSAATPFLAASTALLHQAVLAATGNRPVVAYEWIYGLAASTQNDVVYDIVLGDNDVFDVGCCTAGPGYDQASGWGSLDVGGVLPILVGSPQYQVAP